MSDSANRSFAADRTDLIEYRWFSQTEAAKLTGFSRDAIAALVNAGAPTFFDKINLDMLKRWMEANAKELKGLKARVRKSEKTSKLFCPRKSANPRAAP